MLRCVCVLDILLAVIRSRVALAPIAYTACFVEAASRFLDRAPVTGGPRVLRGFFPSLERTFGTGAFDYGGLRRRVFRWLRVSVALFCGALRPRSSSLLHNKQRARAPLL